VTSTEDDLLVGGSSRDPAVGLRAVAALRRLVEQLEALQVQNARDLGWSWSEIAAAVGVSKQAVHKKHAGRMSGERRQ
jgi:ribosome-binding protein aMBF1 (putative translation factor)